MTFRGCGLNHCYEVCVCCTFPYIGRVSLFSLGGRLGSRFSSGFRLSYSWNMGSLASLMIVVQVISGLIVSIYYIVGTAFDSVEIMMDDL